MAGSNRREKSRSIPRGITNKLSSLRRIMPRDRRERGGTLRTDDTSASSDCHISGEDTIGVTGFNPSTGYIDPPPKSKDDHDEFKCLRKMTKDCEKRAAYDKSAGDGMDVFESRVVWSSILAKMIKLELMLKLEDEKRREKAESRKKDLATRLRRMGRWKRGESGWSSVLEPELSPIEQSTTGTPSTPSSWIHLQSFDEFCEVERRRRARVSSRSTIHGSNFTSYEKSYEAYLQTFLDRIPHPSRHEASTDTVVIHELDSTTPRAPFLGARPMQDRQGTRNTATRFRVIWTKTSRIPRRRVQSFKNPKHVGNTGSQNLPLSSTLRASRTSAIPRNSQALRCPRPPLQKLIFHRETYILGKLTSTIITPITITTGTIKGVRYAPHLATSGKIPRPRQISS